MNIEKIDPYKGTYRIQTQMVSKLYRTQDIGMPEIIEISSESEFLLLLDDIRKENEKQKALAEKENKGRYLIKTIR